MSNQPVARPTGVTILAVLAAIGGVFGLLGGLALVGLGGFVAGAGGGFGGLAMVMGLAIIAQAVLSLAFAYGAWTLKPWGWTLGIAAAGIGLALSAFAVISGDNVGNQVVSIVIWVVVLYYLFTPQVKAAFGRA